MGFEVQQCTTGSESDVTFEASTGANNNNLNYLESRENLPENQDNILDLSSIIKEVENLPEWDPKLA